MVHTTSVSLQGVAPPKWDPRTIINAQGERFPFVQPRRIESVSGLLNVTLDLGWIQHRGEVHALITRALGGDIPGPTLVVSPGDTLRVHFRNRLVFQPTADGPERPDVSNLHFHGLHGSSTLPADDVTLPIGPRGEHTYIIDIPSDHMPGTFWIHPHVHRNSALQGGSGAAAALLVRDPPGYIPTAIASCRDLVFFVQHFATVQQWNLAKGAGDETYSVFDEDAVGKGGGGDGGATRELTSYVLVNGAYKPTLQVAPGEWTRWRLIYPGQQAHPGHALDLSLGSGSCEMRLLAKDGVYLADGRTRRIQLARVPAGGRADVMVRCAVAGSVDVYSESLPIARLDVSGMAVQSADLPPWSPPRPSYLTDLSTATIGCGCRTWFGTCDDPFIRGERCVNGREFRAGSYLHVASLGEVQERTLGGIDHHPYHQHMFPFQLISGFNTSEYFQPGDWHDTYQDSSLSSNAQPRIRFRPLSYSGRMMVHCHWSQHADDGMMTSEHILANGSSTACACEAWAPAPAEHPTIEPPNTICGRVECYEGDDDTITELVMFNRGVSGTIPTEIGRFRSVRYLGLGSNSLSGTVPSELGKLRQLTHLHLWNNRLSGTLATELSQLAPTIECNLARARPTDLPTHFDATCGGNRFDCPLPPLQSICATSASCTNRSLPCAPSPAPPPPLGPPLTPSTMRSAAAVRPQLPPPTAPAPKPPPSGLAALILVGVIVAAASAALALVIVAFFLLKRRSSSADSSKFTSGTDQFTEQRT